MPVCVFFFSLHPYKYFFPVFFFGLILIKAYWSLQAMLFTVHEPGFPKTSYLQQVYLHILQLPVPFSL